MFAVVSLMMTLSAWGQFTSVYSTVMVNTNTGLLATPVKIANFWGWPIQPPAGIADNGKVYAYNAALGQFDLQAAGSGVVWGGIGGSLTNQTDIWTQLTNRYTKSEINGLGFLTNGAAGVWTNLAAYYNDAGFLTNGAAGTWTNLAAYYNDAGFLTNGQGSVNFGLGLTINSVSVTTTNDLTNYVGYADVEVATNSPFDGAIPCLSIGTGYTNLYYIARGVLDDGTRISASWSNAYVSLYFISPDGAYTNLLGTF
jgi:hypothetical protein